MAVSIPLPPHYFRLIISHSDDCNSLEISQLSNTGPQTGAGLTVQEPFGELCKSPAPGPPLPLESPDPRVCLYKAHDPEGQRVAWKVFLMIFHLLLGLFQPVLHVGTRACSKMQISPQSCPWSKLSVPTSLPLPTPASCVTFANTDSFQDLPSSLPFLILPGSHLQQTPCPQSGRTLPFPPLCPPNCPCSSHLPSVWLISAHP